MDINEMQEAFLQKQNELRKGIDLQDGFDPAALKLVAGVDLAYWKEGDDEWAVCCVVVIDYATHMIVEKRQSVGKIEVPYMPGFLAFREIPLVLKAVEILEHVPDIYFFDGNGYLHPRHMGIATHASFYLKRPTVGIAKSYFCVDGKTDYKEPENEVGNNVSLDTACNLALSLTDRESHIPVPTRMADLETHVARENEIVNRGL